MKRYLGFLALGAVAFFVGPGAAQDEKQEADGLKVNAAPFLKKMSDAQFVRKWMTQDCSVGEEGALLKELRRRGAALEDDFLQEFDAPGDPQNKERAAWRRRWKRSRKLLEEGETFGLRPAQLARVRQDTREAFDRRAEARVAERQRTAALSALFYVGGPDSLRRLKPLLQTDRDDPFLRRTFAAIQRRQ